MARNCRFATAGAVLLGVTALLASDPVRPDEPVVLRDEGAVKADGLVVEAFTLSPEGRTAYLVGVKAKELEEAATATEPGGVVVDLSKRMTSPFVNDHTGPIRGMARSSDGRRVYTIGEGKDAVVRVWDAVSGKTTVFADFTAEVTAQGRPTLCVVNSSGRVAVALSAGVAIIGAGGAGRVDLTHPDFSETVVSDPTVSPDGKVLVCRTFRGKVLAWEVKTGKLLAEVMVDPREGADSNEWYTSDTKFVPGTSELMVCRYTSKDDIPAGKDESQVAAERRAVWAVDLGKKSVRPLGLGHTIHTYRMAVHPNGRWLALVGVSRGEGEFRDEPGSVGELRVYDLTTRTLAFKRQYANFYPMWVEFSADGRRLACAAPEGEVRTWDFIARVR